MEAIQLIELTWHCRCVEHHAWVNVLVYELSVHFQVQWYRVHIRIFVQYTVRIVRRGVEVAVARY